MSSFAIPVPSMNKTDPGITKTTSVSTPPGYTYTYAEFTAGVTVTGTAEGSATSVVSAGTVTYDGTQVDIEVFIPAFLVISTHTLHVSLYDGATIIGELTKIINNTGANDEFSGGTFKRRLTPTATSHTYNVKAWVSAASSDVVDAANGSTGALLPGYIKVTKA